MSEDEKCAAMKFIACCIRVSAIAPDLGQQRREMNRWLKGNRVNPASVRWYIDKATNDPRHRPRRAALQADIAHGQVRGVIVWNLDKLAETTREGLKLLVDWCTKSLRVVSVSQEIDIKGADCAMVAPILRGIADMDDQTRRERSQRSSDSRNGRNSRPDNANYGACA